MPELPEVETVRVQLWERLRGASILKVEIFHPKTVGHDKNFARKLKGLTFAYIDRIGKLLIFSFKEKPGLFMLGHLKMTGQFFYVGKGGALSGGGHKVSDADLEKFPGRHTRAAIHLKDGTLYFNDMRLFGYLRLTNNEGVDAARSRFGPEPISTAFDHQWFGETLRKKKTSVKAALLDQSFVAGLGNIYVDEALFRAGIKPSRSANTLTKEEALKLSKAASTVLKEAIKSGGTTFQNFVDAKGNKGNYVKKLRVFGRQGKPCLKCGTIIKKTRVAGRGTHYCPQCQK